MPLFALSGIKVFAQGRPVRMVALGDSLTAGYGLPGSSAYPAILQRVLQAKGLAVEIGNAGVSGDTASAGRDRLDWSVPEGTELVLLALGANDSLRGVDVSITEKALEEIITRLKERKIRVLVAGMLAPPNNGPEYGRAFKTMYERLAMRHDVPLYPFFLDGVTGNNTMTLPDQLHPNTAGVEEMVRRTSGFVEAGVKSILASR
jgi:acyl-CoA thioesterase I